MIWRNDVLDVAIMIGYDCDLFNYSWVIMWWLWVD